MRRTIVELVDDLDGGVAAETVSFAVEGVAYEIDLSQANAATLRQALAPFMAAGRRRGGRRQVAPAASARAGLLTTMRQWARQEGYTVSDRGRIPREVVRAYEAAH